MNPQSIYQVVLLGAGVARHGTALEDLVRARIRDVSEDLLPAVRVFRADGIGTLMRNAPVVCVYLGGDMHADAGAVDEMQARAATFIPVVDDLGRYKERTPEALHAVNGSAVDWEAPDFTAVVAVVLENLSLLRKERRLFISYLRDESLEVAHQLRVAFDDAGYDTFLDISSVPKGDDFQAVLWHRLLDSDVMIVLDTPNFLKSRWTKEEIAQASAMSVGILRVAWPDVNSARFAELAAHLRLDAEKDFDGARLEPATAKAIVARTEALRARNVAARHDNLVLEFCEEARRAGVEATVQPGRHVLAVTRDGRRIAAIPAVGVPDADRFHEASRRFPVAGEAADEAVLMYDHRGMHGPWMEFLDWLGDYLPVKGLRVTDTFAFFGEDKR